MAASPALLSAQPNRPTLRATESVRIGAVDGPASLASVSAVTVGSDRLVYVLDPMAASVKVFDVSGQYRRTIGRRGSGPGELQNPTRIGLKGDSLWVTDTRLRRVSLYGPDGRFVRTLPLLSDAAAGFSPAPAAAVAADGSGMVVPGYAAMLVENGRELTVPLFRISADGRRTDTVTVLRVGSTILAVPSGGKAVTQMEAPAADGMLWAYAPNGEYVAEVTRRARGTADSAPVRLRVIRSDRRVMLDRRYTYPRTGIGRATRDSIVTALGSGISKRIGSQAEAERSVRSVLQLPSHFPPVIGVMLGGDGTIWLQRPSQSGSQIWSMLDATGAVVADVRLPHAARIAQVGRRAVWAVVKDELDVPFVVRYDLAQ